MFATTKLGRIMTYSKCNSTIMSHDSLTTKSHEVMWQIKNKMQDLLCKAYSNQTWQGVDLWLGKPTIISDNPLITWGHVTNWKLNISSSESSMTPIMAGWWLLVRGAYQWSHLILWQRGNVWSPANSLPRPMAMKLDKLVAYGEVNVPMKSHVRLTTCSHEVTWQTKNEIFWVAKHLWPYIKQGAEVWWGEAHNEVTRLWSRDHRRPRFKLKT